MSPRATGLIVLGATVAVAAAVLLVWVNSDSGTPAAERVAASDPAPAPPDPAPARDAGPTGGVTTSETPRAPEPPQEGVDAGYREYMVGDRLVRDHRTGDKPPIDIPPAVHPPEGRKLDSRLTFDVGEKIKGVLKRCAAELPADARGDKPRLEGLAVIAIKDKQVTVTKATVQLRNVNGDAVDRVKQCVEQGALAITTTTEEADLESYDINLSYAI